MVRMACTGVDHAAGWNPYELRDLAHTSLVGSVWDRSAQHVMWCMIYSSVCRRATVDPMGEGYRPKYMGGRRCIARV